MNGAQKLIKIFAIGFAVFIIFNIINAIIFALSTITNIGIINNKETKEDFSRTYEEIDKIDIDMLSSNITIKSGEKFKIEGNNLKNNVSSKLQNKTLKITEEKKWFTGNSDSGEIILYIPQKAKLGKLKIDSGAGKIQIEEVFVNEFNINQGAGILTISNSQFDKTKIDGGAGKIKILSSKLNNTKIDAGAGKVEIEAQITGESKIECGVGKLDISLIGEEADYTIEAEKGIGSIQIKGEEQKRSLTYGRGRNKIKLEGGIGSININFLHRENILDEFKESI